MQVLINSVGIVIIDIGAIVFAFLYNEHYCIAVGLILLCNIVGGLLYRYNKV